MSILSMHDYYPIGTFPQLIWQHIFSNNIAFIEILHRVPLRHEDKKTSFVP